MKIRASLKIKRISFENTIFIILLCFLSIYKIGHYANSKNYSNGLFFLGFITLIYAAIKKKSGNGSNSSNYSNDLIKLSKRICILFFCMQLVMQIYAYILAFLGFSSIDWLSTNLYSFMAPMFVFASVSIFKERTIELFTKALLYNFALTVIVNVMLYGPNVIIQVLNANIGGKVTEAAATFEVHANSFAIGVLFLYYLLLLR